VEFKLDGKSVRIGGICKGAGMIQPGMSATGARPAARPLHATMLCFITTDAAIEAKTLQACLQEAVAQSFNRITVDGDMSTNDTVLVLANGLAGNSKLKTQNLKLEPFQAALNHVCLELAKKIVRDGEGVTRFVTVRVSGAKSFADADAAARAVQTVRWSRRVVRRRSELGPHHRRHRLQRSHGSRREDRHRLQRARQPEDSLESEARSADQGDLQGALRRRGAEGIRPPHPLNLGTAGALMYAADLTEEYVDFNKGDVSDPGSLGG